MGDQFYNPGGFFGFQYAKQNNDGAKDSVDPNKQDAKNKGRDEDLIIEENTVYEVDRECYERLKRQRKRKM